MEPEFFLTEKNVQCLTYQGYTFYKDKEYKEKIYWKCAQNEHGCKMRLHTEGNEIVFCRKEHNHAGSAINVEKRKIITNLKHAAIFCRNTPQQLVVSTSTSISFVVAPHLPSSNSLKKMIRRVRQQSDPTNPQNLTDLIIPNEFKITHNNVNFLLFDSGSSVNRILIFTTDSNLQVLASSKNWYCDGTFHSAPLVFQQVFSIHVIKDSISIPVVFALLPNKKQESYTSVFMQILISKPNIKPQSIMSDFELAIVNGWKSVFPETKERFCFFHFSQNIYRKICSEGLKQRYDCDLEFSFKIKMLTALAFIPPEDVIVAFELLIVEGEFASEFDIIIDYLEDTYIGRYDLRLRKRRTPRYCIEHWNQYKAVVDNEPRTNNNMEGWHNSFSKLVGTHPTIWKFLSSLKLEQNNNELKLERILAGCETATKKKKYRDYDERLQKIVKKYNSDTKITYLRSVAHNISI